MAVELVSLKSNLKKELEKIRDKEGLPSIGAAIQHLMKKK